MACSLAVRKERIAAPRQSPLLPHPSQRRALTLSREVCNWYADRSESRCTGWSNVLVIGAQRCPSTAGCEERRSSVGLRERERPQSNVWNHCDGRPKWRWIYSKSVAISWSVNRSILTERSGERAATRSSKRRL